MKKQAIRLMPYSDGAPLVHHKRVEHHAQRLLRQAGTVVADSNDDFRWRASCNSAVSVMRLPAGSMASSSFNNNSNSRLNFGLSTRNSGQRVGNLVFHLNPPRGKRLLQRFQPRRRRRGCK